MKWVKKALRKQVADTDSGQRGTFGRRCSLPTDGMAVTSRLFVQRRTKPETGGRHSSCVDPTTREFS
eukprot:205063-Amorphochlora_amoeboformis.AAC.1